MIPGFFKKPDDVSFEDVSNPICVVCREEINGEIIRCTECQTVYHQDCWELVQPNCAVYGCSGKAPRTKPQLQERRQFFGGDTK